ncbi:MAG TPA: OmpA family protein [Croceibacterium sp.]|nr:OmpA family protein [Croceibacterium sp.]
MHRSSIRLAAILVALAAPVAAFAQVVSGPFMVFFNTGQTTLTPQAAAILDNAAEAYRNNAKEDPDMAGAQVMIAGHTDRAVEGDAGVRESQIRANNVRDYLVARGIPAGVITTEAFGSTRPLVDTAAGVSEPQNRRVEITFGPGAGW